MFRTGLIFHSLYLLGSAGSGVLSLFKKIQKQQNCKVAIYSNGIMNNEY